jgi:pimeloyl-ACP methyl ester carboxylesterase
MTAADRDQGFAGGRLGGVREERIVGRDGTELAVQSVGQGPLVVLANGLGGSLRAWSPFIDRFGAAHRLVSWDYRGFYDSGPPARPDAVTIADHCQDLDAVLDHVGGDPAAIIGWSMGVQVAVQQALDHPERMAALVLVAGAPGDPLAGLLHTGASRRVVPPLTHVIEWGQAPFSLALRGLVATGLAPGVLRAFGVLAPDADLRVFGDLAHDFSRLDWGTYMRTTRAMARHDAWPRLRDLDVATLVVGGTRDAFLPQRTIEATAAAIEGAELLIIPGATHYLPVEFPAELDEAVRAFLAERTG